MTPETRGKIADFVAKLWHLAEIDEAKAALVLKTSSLGAITGPSGSAVESGGRERVVAAFDRELAGKRPAPPAPRREQETKEPTGELTGRARVVAAISRELNR